MKECVRAEHHACRLCIRIPEISEYKLFSKVLRNLTHFTLRKTLGCELWEFFLICRNAVQKALGVFQTQTDQVIDVILPQSLQKCKQLETSDHRCFLPLLMISKSRSTEVKLQVSRNLQAGDVLAL